MKNMLKDKNMSVYKLAKLSGVPYMTLNDIYNGKTQLEKSSAETVYRIAHALGVPMEDMLAPCLIKRSSFENFKSAVCHRLRDMGDVEFVIDTLEKRDIRTYFEKKWYPESLYLLAMLDYISRINDIPLCGEYDDIRRCVLEKPIYPAGVIAMSAAAKNDESIKNAEKSAIPEFRRFNIIESEVRNVI